MAFDKLKEIFNMGGFEIPDRHADALKDVVQKTDMHPDDSSAPVLVKKVEVIAPASQNDDSYEDIMRAKRVRNEQAILDNQNAEKAREAEEAKKPIVIRLGDESSPEANDVFRKQAEMLARIKLGLHKK